MKRIKKLFKKLNNNGSSVIMVIVALAFVGIIVGALLTAVGYSYRLKLQDMNSRDNFYYVEQAMNEIYAGVGSQTVKDMQNAYVYTVENMVEYDFTTKSYVTKDKDDIKRMFTDRFMTNVGNNDFFSNPANLATELEKFISNDSVKLDPTNLYFEEVIDPKTGKVSKIVIRNVTLTRTQEYSKSVANGSYTQTISTDIEIGEPDFDVLFDGGEQDTANIFSYAMVADMGIEVSQPSVPLAIAGNIYAASDYYNKKYNDSMNVVDSDGNYTVKDESKTFKSGRTYDYTDEKNVTNPKSIDVYNHGSVTSKKYSLDSDKITLFNSYSTYTQPTSTAYYYDGVNERSMYSGIFINDSSVSLMSDMVIVPGTIAVMNEGDLAIYGKSGKATTESEVWVDNIVLGGASDKKVTKSSTGETVTYSGSTAMIRGDLFVKDDTEINANGAQFVLRGSYYGYGDSTERDARVFIPTVDEDNFTYDVVTKNADNTTTTSTYNRGHYNSSAIIVNGEQSILNLLQANVIYLAGRSYIELSKDVVVDEVKVKETDEEGKTTDATKVVETYTFLPETDNLLTADEDDKTSLRDYKTGESISLKTNQLAYIPIKTKEAPELAKDENGVSLGYYQVKLDEHLDGVGFFETFFPKTVFDGKVPCVVQVVSGKKYYYYDFERAYKMIRTAYNGEPYVNFIAEYPSAQYFASAFIEAYSLELNNESSDIAKYLTDISDFADFDVEPSEIILPTSSTSNIYSSGAITTKNGKTFSIVRSADWNVSAINSLLTSTNASYNNGLNLDTSDMIEMSIHGNSKYIDAYNLSNDFEMEYNLVKWNLGHYKTSIDSNVANKNAAEILYIQDLVKRGEFGEASITPINKYLNMNVITETTKISPAFKSGDKGPNVLDLGSGYSVWISYGDMEIKAKDDDGGKVRGIVVCKGDVIFNKNVESFEGLIVAGGKVYITNKLKNMTASEAICKQVLNECMMSSDANAETVLKLFKGYENSKQTNEPNDPDDSSTEAKTIDNIDYSDVCRFSNWMKNVE